MEDYQLNLELLEGTYCVCKGIPNELMYGMQNKSDFFSLTKTAHEVSIVCSQQAVPNELLLNCERNWKVLKVSGTLDFSLVGILSNLSTLLTKASISIFVISTFDTDYILVKETNLKKTVGTLEKGGHTIIYL